MATEATKAIVEQFREVGINHKVLIANSGLSKLDIRIPGVEIVQVSSLDYWSSSNRKLVMHAQVSEPNWTHLVLLNEDVQLRGNFIAAAISHLNGHPASVAVCGAMKGSGGKVTYGGYRRISRFFGLHVVRAEITNLASQVWSFNGNLVMVTREAFERCGGWPDRFEHSRADIVLGARLSSTGDVYQLPGFWGLCEDNDSYQEVFSGKMPALARVGIFKSQKGYPIQEHLAFTRELGGMAWMAYFLGPYVRLVFAIILKSRRA